MANFTPQQIEEFLQEFFDVVGTRQYIGARYVPLFGRKDESSIIWDNSAPYEPLTVVLYQGNSFTSRTYVPEGVDILDTHYWANTGNYNAQVEAYRQDVARVNAIIPSNDFDAENTVKSYIDGLVGTTGEDIATLQGIIPYTSFDAQSTVKDYIDSNVTDLEDMIETKNDVLVFDTVSDMQAYTKFFDGCVCKTLGFYDAGDGGDAYYTIDTTDSNTIDCISVNDGFYAHYIPLGTCGNIRQFGAHGDGVTSDATIVKDAIEYLYAKGLAIEVPYGTYLIDTQVVFTNMPNLVIRGFEKPVYGTGGLAKNCRFKSAVATNTACIQITNSGRCDISGISFDGGTNNPQNGPAGLELVNSGNSHIHSCQFHRLKTGLVLNASGISIIENNFVSYCYSNGIYGYYCGDSVFLNNWINTNNVDDTSSDVGVGLALNGCGNSTVIGGKIEWNRIGINLFGACQGIIINSVQFDVNKTAHIKYYNDTGSLKTRSLLITNCRFLSENYAFTWIGNGATNKVTFNGCTFTYASSHARDDDFSENVGPASYYINYSCPNVTGENTNELVLIGNIFSNKPASQNYLGVVGNLTYYLIDNIGFDGAVYKQPGATITGYKNADFITA